MSFGLKFFLKYIFETVDNKMIGISNENVINIKKDDNVLNSCYKFHKWYYYNN